MTKRITRINDIIAIVDFMYQFAKQAGECRVPPSVARTLLRDLERLRDEEQ